MSFEPNISEPDKQNIDADLAKQFSEIFLKKQENIATLLELLEVCLIPCLQSSCANLFIIFGNIDE